MSRLDEGKEGGDKNTDVAKSGKVDKISLVSLNVFFVYLYLVTASSGFLDKQG